LTRQKSVKLKQVVIFILQFKNKIMKILSKTEYDALSEREQVKYELQLEAFKDSEAKRIAKENAKEAIDAMKEELKAEREAELKGITDANALALKDLSEKHQISMDEMNATLKRAKIGEMEERMKGVSELIVEKLSTEEGEKMLKGFFKGQKLEMEVTEKALLKPVGGVAPQFTTIVGPGHDDFHARDLIPVFPTISDVIKFIQFTVDPDADGFGYVAEGAQKPDLGYISTVEQSIVQKIAGLLDISDEMLDDIVGFRAWIAYELPKAYLDFEDYQIYKGAGGQSAILGLWTQADFQTLPLGSVTQSSNPIDKVMAGITEIRMLRRATSGVVISPVQWMEILINKGDENTYTYPIVLRADGVMTIGGIPIYWSNVFLENEGLCGDFARGAGIYQRKGMEIAYSSEHKDNFGKNMVTIRLEGRIALVIRFPEAFKRLFTPGS
jgi:HK97 family phage major capsid protein